MARLAIAARNGRVLFVVALGFERFEASKLPLHSWQWKRGHLVRAPRRGRLKRVVVEHSKQRGWGYGRWHVSTRLVDERRGVKTDGVRGLFRLRR
jgi:hypothetical protein